MAEQRIAPSQIPVSNSHASSRERSRQGNARDESGLDDLFGIEKPASFTPSEPTHKRTKSKDDSQPVSQMGANAAQEGPTRGFQTGLHERSVKRNGRGKAQAQCSEGMNHQGEGIQSRESG